MAVTEPKHALAQLWRSRSRRSRSSTGGPGPGYFGQPRSAARNPNSKRLRGPRRWRVPAVLLGREQPGSMMGPKARAHLDAAFDRLGVEVRAGVEVIKVMPDGIELAGGEIVHSDAAVWTAGVRVSPLATDAGIATDDRGRVLTEPSLRSASHPSVSAVGDAAAVRQSYGVVQFTRADDTPRRLYLTGKRAVASKEFVSSTPPKTYRMSIRFNLPTRMLWTRGGRKNSL